MDLHITNCVSLLQFINFYITDCVVIAEAQGRCPLSMIEKRSPNGLQNHFSSFGSEPTELRTLAPLCMVETNVDIVVRRWSHVQVLVNQTNVALHDRSPDPTVLHNIVYGAAEEVIADAKTAATT